MRIGSSIGLIAVGLILALAVTDNIKGIDLSLVGWILAVVGVVGLVASMAMVRRSRPVAGEPVVRERRVVSEEYPPERVERREY
jgi:hypothetical protein